MSKNKLIILTYYDANQNEQSNTTNINNLLLTSNSPKTIFNQKIQTLHQKYKNIHYVNIEDESGKYKCDTHLNSLNTSTESTIKINILGIHGNKQLGMLNDWHNERKISIETLSRVIIKILSPIITNKTIVKIRLASCLAGFVYKPKGDGEDWKRTNIGLLWSELNKLDLPVHISGYSTNISSDGETHFVKNQPRINPSEFVNYNVKAQTNRWSKNYFNKKENVEKLTLCPNGSQTPTIYKWKQGGYNLTDINPNISLRISLYNQLNDNLLKIINMMANVFFIKTCQYEPLFELSELLEGYESPYKIKQMMLINLCIHNCLSGKLAHLEEVNIQKDLSY